MTPLQWSELSYALNHLVLFAGLAINAGLAFLCGHAIIPSLVSTEDVPPATLAFRWVLYPIFGASLVLTLYALAQALAVAIAVLQRFFPRFAI
jgi:hypothetical protein